MELTEYSVKVIISSWRLCAYSILCFRHGDIVTSTAMRAKMEVNTAREAKALAKDNIMMVVSSMSVTESTLSDLKRHCKSI